MRCALSKNKIRTLCVLIVAFVVLFSACISAPSDPVAIGQLCEPEESSCKKSVLIVRESVGRNQFDYTIENLGTDNISIDVLAVTPEIESVDLMTVDPDAIVARQIHPNLNAGETIGNRITPKLLGTRNTFRVFVLCTTMTEEPCKLKMEYVFASVPVECFDDSDCSSSWLCNVPVGHCAECLSDEDCNSDQTCDALQGRCSPEDTTPSCSTSGSTSPFTSLFFILVFLLVLKRKKRGLNTEAVVKESDRGLTILDSGLQNSAEAEVKLPLLLGEGWGGGDQIKQVVQENKKASKVTNPTNPQAPITSPTLTPQEYLKRVKTLSSGALPQRERGFQIVYLLTLFSIFSYSPNASAVPPPKAAISAGGGVRYLLGDLGEDAQRGIGINITQELRWRYFGAAVLLGTSFYQTSQDPPPFSRGVGTYTVAIGPRFYFGVGKSEFVLTGDIRRVGFLSNSLVRVTGLENDFTATAVGLGYRYHFENIQIKFDTTFAPFFTLPGSVLSFDLSIGFTSN